MNESRNVWDWAYDHGVAVMTGIGGLILLFATWMADTTVKLAVMGANQETMGAQVNRIEERQYQGRGQQQQQTVTVGEPNKERLIERAQDQIIGAMTNGNLRGIVSTNHESVGATGDGTGGLRDASSHRTGGAGVSEPEVAGGDDAAGSADAGPNAVSAAGVQ